MKLQVNNTNRSAPMRARLTVTLDEQTRDQFRKVTSRKGAAMSATGRAIIQRFLRETQAKKRLAVPHYEFHCTACAHEAINWITTRDGDEKWTYECMACGYQTTDYKEVIFRINADGSKVAPLNK
jgi:DNA-directed RNA polymerase subunit M/transcription elongation factor TFIIS